MSEFGNPTNQRDRKALLQRLLDVKARSVTTRLLNRVAYWEVDLDSGRVRGSASATQIFGGVPSEVPTDIQGFLAIVHSADRARVEEAYRRARDAGSPIDIEHRFVMPDGSVRWLHVVSEPQHLPGQHDGHLAGALKDVTERHLADVALLEQQAGLAAAIDAAQLGTFDEDLRTGGVTWRGHHEAIWGYAPGEFDGSYAMFANRVHPDDLAQIEALQAQVRRGGGAFSSEYRLRWPDGSEHWVTEHGRVIASDSGEPLQVIGVVMDITQRKQAQLQIEQLSHRLINILESTTDGFVAMDGQRRYTYVNHRAAKILGVEVDELLGRTYAEVFSAVDNTEFERALERAAETGVPQHIEVEYPEWERWFNSHIYPSEQGLSVFFRDVTRRKRAESEAAAIVQRLHGLAEMDAALLDARSMDEIAASSVLHTRSLLRCWATGFVLIQPEVDRAQFLAGDGWCPPGFKPGLSCSIGQLGRGLVDALQRDGAVQLGTAPPASEGSWVLRELRRGGMSSLLAVALRIDGELAGALFMLSDQPGAFDAEQVVVARDVSDRLSIAMQQISLRERINRHAVELERRVSERTSEVNSANRELEAFSYSVSHDLRAPLAAITGFKEALSTLRGADAGERERHYLERIGESADHMAALIQAMLDLGHVGRAAMHVTRVDFTSIADGAVARLREREPTRNVSIAIDRGMQATGDHVLLSALMDNLVGNAWKFTAKIEQARIAVTATPDEQGGMVYQVSDNGAGFDMRYADRLFQTFKRLHSNKEFPGTGIGLATVQRIVMRHGGTVWAHSEPGVQTVIFFTLDEPTHGLTVGSTA